ncbi:MAG: sulfate transporter CysZ [Gammaproteobacteria bacterium]|nr:sulfate transporter CysZ [Gammaproteobacteria bacterium]MCW5583065.1 sulfate transporter CysZ [Gammaproteobacteria bacterium]
MNNMVLGFHYFLAGFKLIFRPGMRRFVIIPLCINICLFIGLFFLLRYFMIEFNQWFAHYLPAWLQWLSILLWAVFFIGFFVIIIYTFVMVTNIISAPFNSFLAEKVELYLSGRIPDERSLLDNLKDVPRILGRQFSIIGYYIPRALLILILFFVPVIQAVAAILLFLFHAWLMTLTYIDYPTDNHRISMSNVHTWLAQRNWTALGFGTSVLVCSMIPILNFLIVPAAVAGATKFWVDEGNQ